MAKYVVARIMRPASDFRGGIVTNKKLARRLPDGASRSPTLQEYTMNKELYPIPESFAVTGRRKGGSRHDLPADDSGNRHCDARMRADWSHSFGRIRRFFVRSI